MVEPVQPGAGPACGAKDPQKVARLAAALRENLRKRKGWQQAQAAAGGADEPRIAEAGRLSAAKRLVIGAALP
jgi:hypothetical protein